MELTDLNQPEQVALLGLALQIIKADNVLSKDEEQAIARIATTLGEDQFYALVPVSKQAFKTREGMLSAVQAVSRPEAREAIYVELRRIASADGLERKEMQILVWLAQQWELIQQ